VQSGSQPLVRVLLLLALIASTCAAGEPDGVGRAGADISVWTQWHRFTVADGLPDDAITALHVHDGTLWAGTRAGVAQVRAGRVVAAWGGADGMPDADVSAIAVDPATRDVWLGTWGSGLVRLTGGRIDRFHQLNSGLAGDIVFDVATIHDQVWVANSGGVSVFHPFDDRWELYDTRRRDRPDVAVTSLLPCGDRMLAGVWRMGLRRYGRGEAKWLLADQSDLLLAVRAPDACEGSAARPIWSVTSGGIMRCTPGTCGDPFGSGCVQRAYPSAGESDRIVRCAAASSEGAVLIGTARSLLVLGNPSRDVWLEYAPDDHGQLLAIHWIDSLPIETKRLAARFPAGGVQALAVDGDGVWIGTKSGLFRADHATRWADVPARAAAPADVAELGKPVVASEPPAIAIYGPRARTITIPGSASQPPMADAWAVSRAFEDAAMSSRGGGAARVRSFVVPAGYDRYDWLLPEDDIVLFAQKPPVAAAVGYLTPRDLIADAVIDRSELPWLDVSADSGDAAAARDLNPWVFTCWGNRPRELRTVFDDVVPRVGACRVGAVVMPDGVSRRHIGWWSDWANKRGNPLSAKVACDGSPDGIERAVDRLLDGGDLDVVLTWCDGASAAALLQQIRRAGSAATFVANAELADGSLLGRVSDAGGTVVALLGTAEPDVGRQRAALAKDYARRAVARRYPEGPPGVVIRSYDATSHVLAAMKALGGRWRNDVSAGSRVDRVALRGQLESMERDVLGELHFERAYGPCRVTVARLVNGAWRSETLDAP